MGFRRRYGRRSKQRSMSIFRNHLLWCIVWSGASGFGGGSSCSRSSSSSFSSEGPTDWSLVSLLLFTTTKEGYNCDPNIIANNKEKSFRKPAVTNHNFSQTLKLLRNHNIRTRTIASSSQLPKLIQSQNFFDYNFFYTPFTIPSTSEIICNKPITAMTYRIDSKLYRFSI